MNKTFSYNLSELRKNKGLSQRAASSDLHISQALLSHYENGSREPGLSFVSRACDYYGVSADYLLGRSDDTGAVTSLGGGRFDAALGCLVSALREIGDAPLEQAAEDYLTAAVYKTLSCLSNERDVQGECAFDVEMKLSELSLHSAKAEEQRTDEPSPIRPPAKVSQDMERIRTGIRR